MNYTIENGKYYKILQDNKILSFGKLEKGTVLSTIINPFFITKKEYEDIEAEEIARIKAEEIARIKAEEIFEEPIPNSLTSRQLRMQLVLMGVDLSIIDSVIDSLPEPQKSLAKINWEYAGTFERDNGMLKEMIPLLGFSEEQMNQIFINGSKL